MHRICRGISACYDYCIILAIEALPVLFEGGIPLYGEKCRRGISVHGIGCIAEIAAQIHLYERCFLAFIIRKRNQTDILALIFQLLIEKLAFSGLSRAVQPVYYYQFSHKSLPPEVSPWFVARSALI